MTYHFRMRPTSHYKSTTSPDHEILNGVLHYLQKLLLYVTISLILKTQHGYICKLSPRTQFVLQRHPNNQCNHCIRYNCMGCPVGQVSDSYLYTGRCKSLMAILEGINRL